MPGPAESEKNVQLTVRVLHTQIEDSVVERSGAQEALRKVAAVAVVRNPYAGRYVEDLQPLIEASSEIGAKLAELATSALRPYFAQSYGKGALVGTSGEQEHANAMLTTKFAAPLRKALDGAKAWIPSFTKRGTPGTSIDVPLACKDALYVRSHYDGMTVALQDAPAPDEIAVIVCLANRGRLNARVGGLRFEDIKAEDGLS